MSSPNHGEGWSEMLEQIVDKLIIERVMNKLVRSRGYTVSKIREPIEYPYIDVLELILQDYMKQNQDIFFVQIGAHDGMSADPISDLIRKHHWRGVLVEPQPRTFKKLVENCCGEDQLIFENCLIGDRDGTTTLYAVRDIGAELPFWVSQSASLDREMLAGALYYWKKVRKEPNIPDDYESIIEELTLPSLTVKTLLAKHHIERLDLLVIDTMGYDFEVLKMFPFDIIKPAIINFEHGLLSLEDQEACFNYLAGLGYRFTRIHGDTVACLHLRSRMGTYRVV
ncbi:MAG: FkbM family methyltransferase [Leptolyngbyaceae cyanobacterium RU_5_1]|nr:FkbM family methyltransferase [Leptolyngbyaceae cyanobacterium RU_5_1]